MMTDIVALSDREYIREFLHRYCFALDRGSVDDVMSLFADECDLELRLGQLHRGREAVHTWYEVLTRKRMDVLRHQVHNQVIELRGEEASSQSYWDVVGDLNGEAMISAGFYEDTLRKRDGEWRFEKKGSWVQSRTPEALRFIELFCPDCGTLLDTEVVRLVVADDRTQRPAS